MLVPPAPVLQKCRMVVALVVWAYFWCWANTSRHSAPGGCSVELSSCKLYHYWRWDLLGLEENRTRWGRGRVAWHGWCLRLHCKKAGTDLRCIEGLAPRNNILQRSLQQLLQFPLDAAVTVLAPLFLQGLGSLGWGCLWLSQCSVYGYACPVIFIYIARRKLVWHSSWRIWCEICFIKSVFTLGLGVLLVILLYFLPGFLEKLKKGTHCVGAAV